VGVVPRKELWDIIQNQGWYHIPVESSPRNLLEIKYLSFYFPSVFGEKLQYQVIYYAPVFKIDIAKRIQLFPDEPLNPRRDKDYYQIHIGKISELPRPILSKRFRRIVHIPTTLERLFSAYEINELYKTSPIEDKMYKGLKRKNISPERQVFVCLGGQTYCLDFCIYCNKANIDVECDGERYHILPNAFTKDRIRNNQLESFGWHVLRFSGKEIHRNLENSLAIILRTISNLKGLKW